MQASGGNAHNDHGFRALEASPSWPEWRQRFDLVRAALAWRGLDLTEVGGRAVDAVIATRFPTWAIRAFIPSFRNPLSTST